MKSHLKQNEALKGEEKTIWKNKTFLITIYNTIILVRILEKFLSKNFLARNNIIQLSLHIIARCLLYSTMLQYTPNFTL